MHKMQDEQLEPDVVVHTILINGLVSEGQLEKAWEEFHSIRTWKLIQPDEVLFTVMIKACAQARDATEAEVWLVRMRENGFLPCIVTFTTIIDSLAKTGNVNKAEVWFRHMQESCVEPDAVIFNSMINACAQAGVPTKAEWWVSHMMTSGFEADAKTYNSLINACARAGDVARAESWFQRMEEDGGCIADTITFGSLIHSCAKVGDVDRAEGWIDEMTSRNIDPNIMCLNTVLHACAQAGDRERGEKWFHRVAAIGKPNKISYNSMIEACARSRAFDSVRHWLTRMVFNGIDPDYITQAMLQRCRGDADLSGTPQQAAQWSYCEIMRTYAMAGQSQTVAGWLDRMVRAQVQVPPLILEDCLQIARSSGQTRQLAEMEAVIMEHAYTKPCDQPRGRYAQPQMHGQQKGGHKIGAKGKHCQHGGQKGKGNGHLISRAADTAGSVSKSSTSASTYRGFSRECLLGETKLGKGAGPRGQATSVASLPLLPGPVPSSLLSSLIQPTPIIIEYVGDQHIEVRTALPTVEHMGGQVPITKVSPSGSLPFSAASGSLFPQRARTAQRTPGAGEPFSNGCPMPQPQLGTRQVEVDRFSF
mmetsp:Transcript_22523/g.63370  ORF Transcript_22523/g.63370 Transcript_22523/m.63370 type:complete len:590 (+) Transcript_22523:3-1772(+)